LQIAVIALRNGIKLVNIDFGNKRFRHWKYQKRNIEVLWDYAFPINCKANRTHIASTKSQLTTSILVLVDTSCS